MRNKYKLEFVNSGREFEVPKLSVGQELDILDHLSSKVKEGDSSYKKNLLEYSHACYLALNKVDDDVTEDMILDNMSFDDMTDLYLRIRFKGAKIYKCPKCSETFSLLELIQEINKGAKADFREPKKDTTEKSETS